MTALAIALGLVGLAAVLAARDVAVRWLAARQQAVDATAQVEALRSEMHATLGAHVSVADALGERITAAHDLAADARSIAIDVRTSSGLRGRG
jgi:hypothetical protein